MHSLRLCATRASCTLEVLSVNSAISAAGCNRFAAHLQSARSSCLDLRHPCVARLRRGTHSQARPGSHLQCRAILAELLAFVPGVCFDKQCQEAADRAFLIVTTVPLLGLLTAIILRFRPASSEKIGSDQVPALYINLSGLTGLYIPCRDVAVQPTRALVQNPDRFGPHAA